MPLMGCSETSGDGGSGGSAGTGGTGGANTTPVTVNITGWDPVGGSLAPLEDVDFCHVGTDYCVTSDSEGMVTLLLPTGEEVAFTMVKEGYLKYMSAVVVPEEPMQRHIGIATEERGAYLHDLLMSPYPMEGTGDILIAHVGGGAFPGATLELVGATGKGYYYNEEGDWDSDLTATTSYPFPAWGGFTEVSPGEVEITWGGTAEDCILSRGWLSDTENTMRLPVMAGFVSLQDVICTPQ
jgi:hypothetical protein